MADAEPKAPRLSVEEIHQKVERGEVFFLDVRESGEIAENGSLRGYVNISIKQLEARLGELPKDKVIITA